VALTDAVAISGACSRNVERSGRVGANAISHNGGCRRRLVEVRHGGHNYRVNLAGFEARVGKCGARGSLSKVNHVSRFISATARDDSRALANPLIGGINGTSDVIVSNDVFAADSSQAQNLSMGRALGLGQNS